MSDARPATGMIIRRPCPKCGAPVRHAEGDGVAACEYCGIALAIAPTRDGVPSYVLHSRLPEAELPIRAKRALRERGIRLRELHPPRRVHLPFYRLHAESWLCYREPPPRLRDADGEPVLQFDPPPGEVRFRIGRRDLSLTAAPELGLGPSSLGIRTSTCEATALADETALELAGATLGADDARAALLHALPVGATPDTETVDQRLFVPEAALMRIHAPVVLFPFRGTGATQAVALDGLDGSCTAILSPEELARLETRIQRLDDERTAPIPTAPMIPFSCPACSAPLPRLPEARLHSCPICLRLWAVTAGGFEPVASRLLRPVGRDGSMRRVVSNGAATGLECWLPFYRLRVDDQVRQIPAFHGRHPRAVWNFTFSLNRRAPDWIEEEEATCRPGAAVERTAPTAAALLPFLDYCLERPETVGPVSAELCWIGFLRRGPDLVEPGLGLGFPSAAIKPWDAGVPEAAARRG